MKVDAILCQGKAPSLEEGPIQRETKSEGGNAYSRCMQFLKVLLYLESIVFIAWMGCIFYTNYYQSPTVENETSKVPEWEQRQDSLGSLVTSNSTSAESIELPLPEDNVKSVIQQSGSSMELVIDEVGNFDEVETTTPMSATGTRDKDIQDAMLLSAWLHVFTGLPNNWNDGDSNHDFSSSETVTSAESMEDPYRATSALDYLDTTNENNDDFSTSSAAPWTWINDVFNPTALQSSESDDSFDSNTVEDSFPNGIVICHFGLPMPELMEDYLSQEAIITNGQEEDFPNSSTEEEDSAALRYKRSIDDSSSEENISSRFTNGSSNESNSSNSSSSESSEATTEARKKGNNCPKILDGNGQEIVEQKDIINHIKRNWFNWILATPIPDCDKQQFARIVTIDECGRFVVKCAPDERDETSEVSREHGADHRHTRNVVMDDEAKGNECEELSPMMQNQFDRWITNFVAEETSDPIISKLRQDFKSAVHPLAALASMQEFLGEHNTTAQEWLNLLTEIRQNISLSMNADNRRVLEARVIPTQEMANGLRQIVEAAVRNVSDCVNVLASSGKASPEIMFLQLVMRRRQCMENQTRNEAMEDALAADLVKGGSSDPIVMEGRGKLKSLIRSLAKVIVILELLDPGVVLSSNVTEEAWKTVMLDLKQEFANVTEDSSHRQRFEPDVVPTPEQANRLRAIMESYVHSALQCEMMVFLDRASPDGDSRWGTRLNRNFKINDNKGHPRERRAVVQQPLPISTAAPCSLDEDEIQLLRERKERLETWNKEVAADKSELRVSLLDAIDAELKAENTSKIVINNFSAPFSSLLVFANKFIGNSSSHLRREGYEIVRDLIVESQKLNGSNDIWKKDDVANATENLTPCLALISGNFTPENVFMVVVKTGEAVGMRYSAHDGEKQCGDLYRPAYGQLTYAGEKPEDPIVRNWRHIFSAIIKLYFKIYDPEALPKSRCTSTDVKSQTEPSTFRESREVVKRSISYSNRRTDNTVHFDDNIFLASDDTASIKRIDLDLNGEPRIPEISQKTFFDRMEMLSSHIDRLHEIYQKYNELNDDYVSKEFPYDSAIDYEYE